MFQLRKLINACTNSCSAFERRRLMSFLNSLSAFMWALALYCSDFGQVYLSRCFFSDFSTFWEHASSFSGLLGLSC